MLLLDAVSWFDFGFHGLHPELFGTSVFAPRYSDLLNSLLQPPSHMWSVQCPFRVAVADRLPPVFFVHDVYDMLDTPGKCAYVHVRLVSVCCEVGK